MPRPFWALCFLALAYAALADEVLPELRPAHISKRYATQITLSVTGTIPFTYALGGEEKPAGLSINPSTGVLQGVPTRAALGTHRLHIVVTDFTGKQTTQDYLLHISDGVTDFSSVVVSPTRGQPGAAAQPVVVQKAIPVIAATNPIATPDRQISTGQGAAPTESPVAAPPQGTSAPVAAPGFASSSPVTSDQNKGPAPAEVVRVSSLQSPPAAAAASPAVTATGATSPASLTGQSSSIPVIPPTPTPAITLAPPRIQTPLHGGQTQVTVAAQASGRTQTAPAAHVQLLLQNGLASTPCDASQGFPIALSKGADAASTVATQYSVTTDANGIAILNLANPLENNQYVCAFETYQNADGSNAATNPGVNTSTSSLVVDPASQGRVLTYFTGGILLANDDSGGGNTGGGSFSTAHEFLDLYVEKSWLLPGCYLHNYGNQEDEGTCAAPPGTNRRRYLPGWGKRHYPGVSTFFDARLTAIPVSQSTSLSGLNSATPSGSSSTQTFNTSQKTARLAVGAYLPFLLTRWDWDYAPNSLFLAPLAKVGFDTLTGPTTQTITDPNGSPATLSYERLYNFYGFGTHLGHMGLTNSNRQAPELLSYLDILSGPYSNLQSYICHPGSAPGQPFTGSDCPQGSVDSRKRLYRLDFEGMLKIPHLPVIVGFNANIGQRSLGAAKLDQHFQPPDDLRFLFGTRFDVSAALSKLGLVSSTTGSNAKSPAK